MESHIRDSLDASYYQKLHDDNPAFQNNNWLTAELDLLKAYGGRHLLEVGCGNGRFLELAAPFWDQVVGMDWARSPHISEVLAAHSNVRFIQKNILDVDIAGGYDLVVSADFLEHLAPDDLPVAMSKLLAAGPVNFHKIACYDDGHSHLSIFPPQEWIRRWHALPGGETMRIVREEPRKGNWDKVVMIVANG